MAWSTVFCLVLFLSGSQANHPDGDFDEDEPSNPLDPVADPDHSRYPDAGHLDDDFRPPEAMEGGADEDLGAVETLNSAPTPEELKRFAQMAGDKIDETNPYPFTSGPNDSASPQQQNLQTRAGEQRAMRSGSGFDSRAAVAINTANAAIEKAKRAAEEARLAIAAAEAAKQEADLVTRNGGDGGPALEQQTLLAVSERDAMHDSRDDSMWSTASDLGLPNPNPPSRYASHDASLNIVNHAQLSAALTPKKYGEQVEVDLHRKILSQMLQDKTKAASKRLANYDEGEGDEASFGKSKHIKHQKPTTNHVKLAGDSEQD
eukprot:c14503_g1_i1.p1 GENE.c14503_g1_i1~~c14503_g1_i1.p1  ORF type:complete len:331 (+),score=94.42 c14503_g1_i1:41-994(+)